MRIAFRSRSFGVTPGLRAHTQRSLLYALGRFSDEIDDVVVRFSDLNGPRGGIDKVCRFDARLVRGDARRVEDVDRDLYAAIDRAADRLGRAVARAIDRNRDGGARSARLVVSVRNDRGDSHADRDRQEAIMKSHASAEERADRRSGREPEAPAARPSPEDVARRAYEIYAERGGGAGDPMEDWLQAERELTKA